jgi:single-stranded DNA-binding protein
MRLSLAGRVGADPTFRVTPKGTLVGRFPLAVHAGDNTTTWEQVLSFNARAEKLKDAVHKGDAVQVVGYMHEREGRGRDGQPKTIREVYAVTVTARAK